MMSLVVSVVMALALMPASCALTILLCLWAGSGAGSESGSVRRSR
jgi:hypothetical protein